MMEVLVCHYNTPEFLNAALQSLFHFSPSAHVTVFENSDRRPWEGTHPNVSVIDNTRGQIIDFSFLSSFARRVPTTNNWGSAKHCASVDRCFELLPGGFLLIDSDVIVKRDIAEMWDEQHAWVGEVEERVFRKKYHVRRVFPHLCFINVPMLKAAGVRYFDGNRCWKLTDHVPRRWYDTGASFYEDTLRLPHHKVRLSDYVDHYGCGSYHLRKSPAEWIKDHSVQFTF